MVVASYAGVQAWALCLEWRDLGRLRYWLHPLQAPKYGAGIIATEDPSPGSTGTVRREAYVGLTGSAGEDQAWSARRRGRERCRERRCGPV